MNKNVEEEKKFKTEEVTMQNGSKMLRIIALRTIETSRGIVEPGEPGGLIANENCLSQYGDCWVRYDAKVLNNAHVWNDAQVFGNATIADDANIYDQAEISGNAIVMHNAEVTGSACIYDNARVSGSSHVGCYAKVYGNASISKCATVFDHATVRDSARVLDNAEIHGHAIIEGESMIRGNSEIFENAIISASSEHNIILTGRFGVNAYIDGKAIDYIVAGPFGSRDDMTTVYYTKNGLYVCCGCFNAPIDDFHRDVVHTYFKNKKHSYYQDYISFISFAISILNRHHGEALANKQTDTKQEPLCNIRANSRCECECSTIRATDESCDEARC